ncbi:MAG: pyridoxamine 5'-phosphate oxidase family protein [Candidatus Dormiibacterota bacterium]
MTEGRSVEKRTADVREALAAGHDGWLATASASGRPHLIAVSCWWDGTQVVMTTVGSSRSARNLAATRQARLALGSADDVVMVDVELGHEVPVNDAPAGVAEGFATGVGWDPREIGPEWVFLTLRPNRIQAYRGYDELAGRDVMRNGAWLA